MTIQEIMRRANKNATSKGFWESPVRTFGDQIALMHSELSEALEEFRDGRPMEGIRYVNSHGIEVGTRCGPDPSDVVPGPGKPEGIAAEFADVIIRIADTCQQYGIPLDKAIKAKMDYNETRPHKHGGKVI